MSRSRALEQASIGTPKVGRLLNRIPRADGLFDHVVTSFGAFNKPVDVVARNEDFLEAEADERDCAAEEG